MTRRTDAEVMDLLQNGGAFNKARIIFSGACGKIEQAGQQRSGLSPIELRRMEFEAVEEIAAVLGVSL
jgi:hypothetical protein